jgi:hypothetical protein
MVSRRPLVFISGQYTELPLGDEFIGGSIGSLTAGSGLAGGGDLSGNVDLSVSITSAASGLIFVGDSLGVDGRALADADSALASGNFGLEIGSSALASGVTASQVASDALASGNLALNFISTNTGGALATFVASSAIASGHPVGLDDTGRIQTVREAVRAADQVVLSGSSVVFETAATTNLASVYDPTNQKIVHAYTDVGNTSFGTAVVGTVSGSSISFGTPVVFEAANTQAVSSVFDIVNSGVYVAYKDLGNSSYGTALVGAVSGTTILFGTPVVFESAALGTFTSSTYDSLRNNIVTVYSDEGNSSFGTAVVGSVSGTSVSFGAPVVFASTAVDYPSVVYASGTDSVVICYRNDTSTSSEAVVGTVSGTSLSFGSPVLSAFDTATYIDSVYEPVNDRVVVSYRNAVKSSIGTTNIGVVSGTTISFSDNFYFSTSTIDLVTPSTIYDSINKRLVTAYVLLAGDQGACVVGNLTGDYISYGPRTDLSAAITTARGISSVFNSDAARTIISYRNNDDLNRGTSIVAEELNQVAPVPVVNNQNNFIGISQETVASGSLVQVRLPGSFDQNFTGLTPGASYYLDPSSSGITVSSGAPVAWSGAVPWTSIGRALDSTTLLLTDTI